MELVNFFAYLGIAANIALSLIYFNSSALLGWGLALFLYICLDITSKRLNRVIEYGET